MAEKSRKNQERGVHANNSIILSHTWCNHVVLLWLSPQRQLHCCKRRPVDPKILISFQQVLLCICLMYPYTTQVPNVLGFVLGVVQMVLYAIYRKNAKKVVVEPNLQLQELREEIIDVVKLSAAMFQELNPVLAAQLKDVLKDSVGEDDQIVEMPSKAIKA